MEVAAKSFITTSLCQSRNILCFFFSSRRRHTRYIGDWVQTCALPISLDLSRDAGREVFHDLVRRADVVWENFRPGVMERLGCAYSKLWSLNQRVIVCSISAYGQDGPYRDWPAFDLALQAMGGAMSLTGEPGRAPVRMGLPMGDLTGGIVGAFAVAAAPFRRERTGEGTYIDLPPLARQSPRATCSA